jgi:hypothetical protein
MKDVTFPLLKQMTPASQYQEVDVTFGAADTDFEILHRLQPPTPEHVNYQILRKDRAADVYHDATVTRKAWRDGVVILRCSTANAKVTLLLTVAHDKRALTF